MAAERDSQKFEAKVIEVRKDQDLDSVVKAAYNEGWRVTGVAHTSDETQVFFEREVVLDVRKQGRESARGSLLVDYEPAVLSHREPVRRPSLRDVEPAIPSRRNVDSVTPTLRDVETGHVDSYDMPDIGPRYSGRDDEPYHPCR